MVSHFEFTEKYLLDKKDTVWLVGSLQGKIIVAVIYKETEFGRKVCFAGCDGSKAGKHFCQKLLKIY